MSVKPKINEVHTNTVTIKGVTYRLGGVNFSDENLAVFEKIATLTEDGGSMFTMIQDMSKDFRRMLKEAITDGESEEKAEEAISNLKLNFSPESDLMRAFEAIIQSLMG